MRAKLVNSCMLLLTLVGDLSYSREKKIQAGSYIWISAGISMELFTCVYICERRVSRLHPDAVPASPFAKWSLPFASGTRTPAEPLPEAVNGLSAKQKAAPGLLSLAASKRQPEAEESGDRSLKTYFKRQPIAARRPPHKPVMRAATESLQPRKLTPGLALVPTRGPDAISGTLTGQHGVDVRLNLVEAAPSPLSHREVTQFVKQRLADPAVGAGHAADTAVSDRIRTQLRALYNDSLYIRKAERIAAARATLMSVPPEERAKINPFRSDNSLSLGTFSGSFGVDALRPHQRSSVDLVGPLVAETSSIMSPVLGPGGVALTASEPNAVLGEDMPLPRWGPGPVAESISDDVEVPAMPGTAAVSTTETKCRREQLAEAPAPAKRQRTTRTSAGWGFNWMLRRGSKERASRGSFMPRRWSLIQVRLNM